MMRFFPFAPAVAAAAARTAAAGHVPPMRPLLAPLFISTPRTHANGALRPAYLDTRIASTVVEPLNDRIVDGLDDLDASSVLKKRRAKMRKHKRRKLRRRTRNKK